ncbi:lipocalin family protein [Sphingobacterium sp. Mn56C]|uniref:lipocalin family protein n=1 Tax=Sphingobacterium sp. Mn56C TaxID=3395261 RepID=UPI003BE38EBC
MNRKESLLLVTAAAAGAVIYNIWKPIKSNLPVVADFVVEKYVGTWHEIARLDFYWEKNLKDVTATYTLNKDGSIQVLNRGIHVHSNKEKTAKGKAKFVDSPNKGALKVSFFGPFYAAYNVMHIAGDYEYALVFGQNLDYMWILSRTQTIPENIKEKYLSYAQQAGYDIAKLVWSN